VTRVEVFAALVKLAMVKPLNAAVNNIKMACAFSIDDHVLAAITLYLDLINMFVYILSLFGD
jgi:FtsH-binding integral membrane protein